MHGTCFVHAEAGGRSRVEELRDCRNKWAHQEQFSFDDAYRVLDTSARLLAAVSALEAAVEASKEELLRLRYDQHLHDQKKQAGSSASRGPSPFQKDDLPAGNLRSRLSHPYDRVVSYGESRARVPSLRRRTPADGPNATAW